MALRAYNFGSALLGAAVLLPLPARGQSPELPRVTSELAAIGVEITTLAGQLKAPEAVGGDRSFSKRLTDGEILFLLADYGRASLILFDLVGDPKNRSEPLYPRALYYLAESLFQIGHDLSARERFQEIVTGHDAQYLGAATGRLIEIADRNQSWQGLDEHIAVLEARGQLPPGVAYLRAKSLVRRGRPAEALKALAAVPADHELALKAAYLRAVSSLQAGELAAARDQFATLVAAGTKAADSGTIRDLAAMNRGRILLEEGRFAESVDAYQFVSRQSPLFEEALYEITWTYVRAADAAKTDAERVAEFKKAQNALEILLLSEAENPIAPEARLLLGNIRIRLGQLDAATETFDEVVQRYAPVRDELKEIGRQAIAPEAYFAAVSQDPAKGRGLLPPLAVHWARGEGQLSQALAVLAALDESAVTLREADQLTTKLLAQLESAHRVSFFPGLQEMQAEELELRNRLTDLSMRLLAVEREAVRDKLGEPSRDELDRVLAEREQMEPAYRALPQRREEYEGRVAQMRAQMLALQQQAYRLKYDINSMRAQLNALRVWVNQNQDGLPASLRADYQQRIEQQEREVEALEAAQVELEQQVVTERGLISIASRAEVAEEELRARYQANLDRERELLAQAGGGKRKEIEAQREVIARYLTELDAFARRVDEVVGGKAKELEAEVLKERNTLDRHREAMLLAREAAERVIGEVARGSLADVQQRFRGIVLRADVGIVDVAWASKEQETHEISRKVNEQRRELSVLDNEFADVLRED
jgi:hypothetical protein